MGNLSETVPIRPFEKLRSDSIPIFQNISLHAYRLGYLSSRFRESSVPDPKTSFRCYHDPLSVIKWEARGDQRNWPKTKDYILWLYPMTEGQWGKANAFYETWIFPCLRDQTSFAWPLDVFRSVLWSPCLEIVGGKRKPWRIKVHIMWAENPRQQLVPGLCSQYCFSILSWVYLYLLPEWSYTHSWFQSPSSTETPPTPKSTIHIAVYVNKFVQWLYSIILPLNVCRFSTNY